MHSLDEGIYRYREECAKSPMNQWPSTRRLMAGALEGMVEGIERARAAAEAGRAMKWCQGWGIPFMVMEPGPLALATLSTAFECLTRTEAVTAASMVSALGQRAEMEYHFLCLREEFPKLLAVMGRRIKKWNSRCIHRACMRMQELSNYGERWEPRQRRAMGNKLLELLVQHTDIFNVVHRTKRGKRKLHVIIRPERMDDIAKLDGEYEILAPMFQPMVVPPLEWAPGQRGGYQLLNPYTDMVIQKGGAIAPPQDHDERVYRALNIIQSTPWRINRRVLETMQQVWAAGGGYAGVPPQDNIPDLPRVPDDRDKVAIAERNKKQERIHMQNARLVGKRLVFGYTLDIAERFAKYEAIWFPHRFDFRGRIYPLPVFLNPQGPDVARGLLEFAEGVELGVDGVRWLKIHYANCWGMDKISFRERVEWADRKLASCWPGDVLADPLRQKQLWLEADDPWQALACALELAAAYAHNASKPETYISRLPVSVDGSNSGLQHFTAMLRDPHGARLVNLAPSPQPHDIYSDVAKWVKDAVQTDAASESGYEPAESEAKMVRALAKIGTTIPDMAKGWLEQGIDRKLAKRPAMTYTYGVTPQGLRDALIADGFCDWHTHRYAASRYIGKKMWQGILANVTAASEGMEWLRACAAVANKAGILLEWRSPIGFHVSTPYRSGRYERIKCLGSEIHFVRTTENDPVSQHKQRNSMPPNFVHHLDATHLMMVALAGDEAGITAWQFVHDAFGTHAGNMPLLHGRILREQFVALYSMDVMEQFRQQVWQQTGTMPPPPPQRGSFCLEDVLQSEYIFS